MAESPFPDIAVADLETFQSFDPELSLDRTSIVQQPAPFGVTPRIDFVSGDLEVTDNGSIPWAEDHAAVAQWALQVLLTERFESPLVGDSIGISVRDHIGETIEEDLLYLIAGQIGPALMVHDRISSVDVQRVFSIENSVYIITDYVTDDFATGTIAAGI